MQAILEQLGQRLGEGLSALAKKAIGYAVRPWSLILDTILKRCQDFLTFSIIGPSNLASILLR